jgi:hypothetical protein
MKSEVLLLYVRANTHSHAYGNITIDESSMPLFTFKWSLYST